MRYLKFVLPLILLACIDLAFQLGAWEPLASPQSHAGMSISLKRALDTPAFAHIDLVTLGSSRPVYGIDHEALTRAASARGLVYANLSVPGMHWMSLGVITDWLALHHPEVQGGIIALAVQDFLAPGNGSYELGIAYPFHTMAEIPWMKEHVAFDWHDPSTYGLYSGLFEYHEDVQDLVAHPLHRRKLLRWFHARPSQQVLQANADETTSLCSAGISKLSDCATMAARDPSLAAKLAPQCRVLEDVAKSRYDLRPYLDAREPLPARLAKARDLIRAQLRELHWKIPPVVVLMPMHDAWLRDAMPQGTHAWALHVLAPLVADGTIRVLDETDLFNSESGTDCSAFFDFYHNNVSGREKLMQRLLPQLLADLSPEAPISKSPSRTTDTCHAPDQSAAGFSYSVAAPGSRRRGCQSAPRL